MPLLVFWIKFSTRDSPVLELIDDATNTDADHDGKISAEEEEEDIEDDIEDMGTFGGTGDGSPKKTLYTVSLFGRSKNTISLFNAILYYYTAPVTKFILTSVSFSLFPRDSNFFLKSITLLHYWSNRHGFMRILTFLLTFNSF